MPFRMAKVQSQVKTLRQNMYLYFPLCKQTDSRRITLFHPNYDPQSYYSHRAIQKISSPNLN